MEDVDEGFDKVAWRNELESHRQEKDRIFAESDQSPIPVEEREEFDGLEYYAPDTDYRVTATVTVHDDPETKQFNVMHGDGETREYCHVATFSFELHDESLSLNAYRETDQEGPDEDGQYRYFAPFKDETSDEGTYSGGRYLEVYADEPLSDDQEITIDFNIVYTPFCAFNDSFACPLPPTDNWLDVPIEAGEKDYEPPETDDEE